MTRKAKARTRRAFAAARLVPGVHVHDAARQMGVSHTTVRAALRVLENGDEQTLAAIEAGEASLHGTDRRLRATAVIAVSLPAAIAEQLKECARRSGCPVRDVMRAAVERYLAMWGSDILGHSPNNGTARRTA